MENLFIQSSPFLYHGHTHMYTSVHRCKLLLTEKLFLTDDVISVWLVFSCSFVCLLLGRMWGSLATIIPERKNAHHSVRQSLDSHDNVEVEAAIFAAASFAAQSKWVWLPAFLYETVARQTQQIQVYQHYLVCHWYSGAWYCNCFIVFSIFRDFAVGICNKLSEMIQGNNWCMFVCVFIHLGNLCECVHDCVGVCLCMRVPETLECPVCLLL